MCLRLRDFVRLAEILNRLQKVERIVYVRDSSRRENDWEHSFQLAFFTWYILEILKLPLNQEKALKYALIHDLVEAYAGDLPFHFRTKEDELKKRRKEAAAIKKISREFPDFKIGPKYLAYYVKRSDREAQFVATLDKFLPVLNIYLDGGRAWKKFKVDFETLVKNKRKKVSRVTEIAKVFEELVVLLAKDKKKFFGKGN